MANAATTLKDTSAERLITMLKAALGPFVAELLSDEKVTELMLNQDGPLWADRLGQGREFTGHRIEPQDASASYSWWPPAPAPSAAKKTRSSPLSFPAPVPAFKDSSRPS
jgi:hypothetical protein